MTILITRTLLYCYMLMAGPSPAKAVHPLHVSTTDISYNAQDGQMEVILTIFTDDFESAIQKQFRTKTDLSKPDMHKAMDELVKKYAASHLQLKAGNIPVQLNYLGYEINREAVNVYLESPKIIAPKKIDAEVSLLQNLYDDQLNIVHMTVAGARKSARLDFPERKISQVF